MDNEGIQLFSFCKKKVGDGKSTLLWDDIWLGDSFLNVQFSRVYALETDKSGFKIVWFWWIGTWFNVDYREGVEVTQMLALREMLATVIISDQRD